MNVVEMIDGNMQATFKVGQITGRTKAIQLLQIMLIFLAI